MSPTVAEKWNAIHMETVQNADDSDIFAQRISILLFGGEPIN